MDQRDATVPADRSWKTVLATPAMMLVLTASMMAGSISEPVANTGLQQQPRPFDPPTLEEMLDAKEVAIENATVTAALGDRYVFLGAALRTEKTPGLPASEHPRLFDVWFYDYTDDEVVWPVIDSTESRVIALEAPPDRFQPSLVGEELRVARDLALATPAVAREFPVHDPLPVTAMLASGEGTACPVNRCAVVAFIEDGRPRTDFLVLVNLSEGEVMKVVEGYEHASEVYSP